jgi:hypothetical protein
LAPWNLPNTFHVHNQFLTTEENSQ